MDSRAYSVHRRQRLRHVVIGLAASIFPAHLPGLQNERAELVAGCDVNLEAGKRRAEELNCLFFSDYRQMLAETQPDVAVILTPHPLHAPIAIDCLRAGCHVLVEKPMAIQVSEADAMIAVAEQSKRLLAVSFQMRWRPEVRAARQLIQDGCLGKIQCIQVSVPWLRTAAYYRSASWRGRWDSEGGGVLMNQAPHDLDLICYLMGSPARVFGWTRTTLHQIEVEDTAHAVMEWDNGALGTLHVSTAEAGRPERVEVTGTAGYLEIGRGTLVLQHLEMDVRDYIPIAAELFRAPDVCSEVVELEPTVADHAAVYRNLHAAILEGEPLVVDGTEGRKSLELANAITLSSLTRREVTLPLDPAEYAALLADLRAHRVAVPGSRGSYSAA